MSNIASKTKELQLFMQKYTEINGVSTTEIRSIYTEFVDCLVDHNHLYYIENGPIISDKEYDDLFAYLQKIEASHPDLISGNSPTQNLMGQVSEGFQQARHTVKLASLENTYNAVDLRERDERAKKILEKQGMIVDLTYLVEPKFDGVSVELIYKDGYFKQAITRGDGRMGDDITNNVKTIKNIPKKLKLPVDLQIRGEIMMPKSVRKEINEQRESDGETPFANTRNAAAGSIKLLDSKEVEKRGLVCYVYDILDMVETNRDEHTQTTKIDIYSKNISGEKTEKETDDILSRLGLPVYPRIKSTHSIEEIITICEDTKIKEELLKEDIDFDGLVIKIDDIEVKRRRQETYFIDLENSPVVEDTMIRSVLGSTEHHPRRAVAYKFPAQLASTRILSVDFQVGRTGILTPVANLEETELSGVTIKRVSLHNADFIASKDLHINDYIRIQRSGEVIPYVVGVISERRTGEEKQITMPDECPSCGGSVVQEDMHYYCTNPNCPQKLKQQLIHFVSKQALDIQGIGESMIDVLVDQKILKDVGDMYTLGDFSTQVLLRKFPGFADKKVSELANNIEGSKTQSLRRLLNGLGISHVGKKLAQDLETQIAQFLGDLKGEERVQELIKTLINRDFLFSLYGIGEKTVDTIATYFADSANQKLLYRLLDLGFQFVCGTGNLRSKDHFSITGTFPFSREQIVQAFEKEGYVFDESPKKATNFILIGENAGSKKEKAEEMGITIYENRNFLKEEFPFLKTLVAPQQKQAPKANQQSLF